MLTGVKKSALIRIDFCIPQTAVCHLIVPEANHPAPPPARSALVPVTPLTKYHMADPPTLLPMMHAFSNAASTCRSLASGKDSRS